MTMLYVRILITAFVTAFGWFALTVGTELLNAPSDIAVPAGFVLIGVAIIGWVHALYRIWISPTPPKDTTA